MIPSSFGVTAAQAINNFSSISNQNTRPQSAAIYATNRDGSSSSKSVDSK